MYSVHNTESNSANNNKQPINERFGHLLGNPMRSDFTFIIEEDQIEIPAHKLIIGAGSAVLDKIVYGSGDLKPVNKTIVQDCSRNGFLEVLRYLYTDTANITEENVLEILNTANYYDIPILQDKCTDSLIDLINVQNVCLIYQSLYQLDYENITRECLDFIAHNVKTIVNSTMFSDINVSVLKVILQIDPINITELELCKAALNWAKVNCKKVGLQLTTQNLRQVLENAEIYIRFPTMTNAEFANAMELEPGFLSADEITNIFMFIKTRKNTNLRYNTEKRSTLDYADCTWISNNGEIPLDAVFGGINDDGTTYYVGRSLFRDSLFPSNVILGEGNAYVALEGENYFVPNYEILSGNGYEWVRPIDDRLPLSAVVIGHQDDGKSIYVARVTRFNVTFICKAYLSRTRLLISFFGVRGDYDILIGGVNQKVQWCSPEANGAIPENAILASNAGDNPLIYVGRAFEGGDFLPCKIIPSRQLACVPWNCQEHIKTNYQYLCLKNVSWIQSHNGIIAIKAIVGGTTNYGEFLYIGRVRHNNVLIPGKIHPSHGCLYISFDGLEIRYESYEILVRNN